MNLAPISPLARTLKAATRLLLLGACAASTVWAADPPPFTEKMATHAVLEQVRRGGFVLYMRHGNTDNSRPDRVPQVDLNDCSTQRVLNDEGRRVAARVGEAIRKAHIPVGEIFVSPMCRTKETARIAFGDKFTVDQRLMYTSNLTTTEKKSTIAGTRELLSRPVAAGTNRMVIAHAPNLMDLMGYFVKPEATVAVIRPASGAAGYEYVASIPPALWPELIKSK
jgi:phosphohistidine phosphatase SixA